MRITPLDVRKQEFKKVVRGLDPEEVYAFLATLADEYETVLTDNKHLREKVLELDEKVSEYRNMEKTLRDTLLTAERVMADAKENARKEGDVIIREAKIEAERETAQIHARVEGLWGQLRQLRAQRDAFLARLRGLAQAQLGLADSYARDFATDESNTEVRIRGGVPAAPAPEAPEAPSDAHPFEAEEAAYAAQPEASWSAPAPNAAPSEDAWRDYSPGADARPETAEPATPAAWDTAPQSEPSAAAPSEWPPPAPDSHSPAPTASSTGSVGTPIPPSPPKPSPVYHAEEAPSLEDSPLTHLTDGLGSAGEAADESDEFQPTVPPSSPAPPVNTQVDQLGEGMNTSTSVRIADIVSQMEGEPPSPPLGLDGKGLGGHPQESVSTWPTSGEEARPAGGENPSGDSNWSMDNFTQGLGKL